MRFFPFTNDRLIIVVCGSSLSTELVQHYIYFISTDDEICNCSVYPFITKLIYSLILMMLHFFYYVYMFALEIVLELTVCNSFLSPAKQSYKIV